MLRAHPPADQGHFLFQDLPDLEDVNAGESLGDRDRVSSPASPRFHFPPLPAPRVCLYCIITCILGSWTLSFFFFLPEPLSAAVFSLVLFPNTQGACWETSVASLPT